MTAHDEARRRVVTDAVAIDREAALSRRRAERGERVRRTTNAAMVAATTGAVTVGPVLHAAAEEPVHRDAAQAPAPQAPVPDVADVIVDGALAMASQAPAATGPAAAQQPVVAAPVGSEAEPDPVPATEEPGPAAVEGVPGLDPIVVIPLNGRDTMPPPRQTPAGGGVVVPNVQPGSPAGDRLPPTAPPEPGPTTPLPPRPTVDVIVGAPPAPQPQGGGALDLSQDFTDPDIAGDVVTTPLPLEGTTTYTVVAGDSLWTIATSLLTADGTDVTTSEVDAAVQVIYEANRDVIGPDPDLLAIGIVLEIPSTLVPPADGPDTGADTEPEGDG